MALVGILQTSAATANYVKYWSPLSLTNSAYYNMAMKTGQYSSIIIATWIEFTNALISLSFFAPIVLFGGVFSWIGVGIFVINFIDLTYITYYQSTQWTSTV